MPPKGRGKYLGFVAHEIKNPLATALWSCDLLKRLEGAERSGERAEKMIDVSLRALRRMRRLIDDYFMLERLAEDGYELKRERISLKTLVDSALGALSEKDRIPTAGWALEVGEGELTGDLEMLKRAVRCAVEHMTRAILEGSAFALRDILDAMKNTGLEVARLTIVGGGAKGPLWRQIKADVTGLPVRVPSSIETTATGAAILAAVASGVRDSIVDAVDAFVSYRPDVHEPDPATRDLYEDAYGRYRSVYDALRPVFNA